MARPKRRTAPRSTGKRAALPNQNPALKDLNVLIGAWDVELSNAQFLPNPTATVHMRASFEWIEDGDCLVMRHGSKATGPPYATWLIGRDETSDEYVVLYCDDRRVSRVYRMQFVNGKWHMWRDAPGFSQRFTGMLNEDGDTVTASWEMSRDNGKTWKHDFDLTYRRLRQRLPKPRRIKKR
jgi:hypothetical protein